MKDSRIEAKEEKFINIFQGNNLFFIVKEDRKNYDIVEVVHNQDDFKMVYNLKGVYHLFKSTIFGQYIEWVESYNSKTKKSDVPLALDDTSWATLAKLSLEKDMTVNDALVALLKVYINKEDVCQEQKETCQKRSLPKRKRN